jgi:hypothetical protein
MSPLALKQGQDPLEWARSQLDFEAFSKSAPPARAVLYRAQTIVPLSAPRQWTRAATAAGAAALAMALCCAPWVPSRTVLATVWLTLEKGLTLSQAEEAACKAVRHLPESVLAGVQYASAAPLAYDTGGGAVNLRLGLTGVGHGPRELEELGRRALDDAIEGTPEVQAGQPLLLSGIRWSSPLVLAAGVLSRARGQAAHDLPGTGAGLRREVLEHHELFQRGLARHLAKAGYELVGFRFATPGEMADADSRSLTLAAWPAPVEISVRDYEAFTWAEQGSVRRRCEDYLSRLNLAGVALAPSGGPQVWLPIVAEVSAANGAVDRYLSDRLQGALSQPDIVELSSLGFDVMERVDQAVEQVFPGQECRIDYTLSAAHAAARPVDLYYVRISLTGRPKQAETKALPGEENLKDESGIDW